MTCNSVRVSHFENLPTASLPGTVRIMCPRMLVRGNEQAFVCDTLAALERANVLVDMSAVNALDAAGIGVLVTLQTAATAAGKRLYLIKPSKRAAEVLSLVGLDSMLLCVRSKVA